MRAGSDIGEAARMFGKVLGNKKPDGGSKIRFRPNLGSAARNGKQEMRKKWLAEPLALVKPPWRRAQKGRTTASMTMTISRTVGTSFIQR